MRTILSFAFVALMFTSGMLYSSGAHAADLKIAQFDLQKVALGAQAFKDAQKTADAALKPLREQLEKEKKAIEASMKAMGPNPAKEKAEALRKRQSQYMTDATGFVENVQNSEMLIREGMDSLILQAASNYGKNNGYDMILDVNAIIFKKDVISIPDVTGELIKEVDRVWTASKK